MKKLFKKILISVAIFIVMVIIAIIVIPMFFKGELINLAKKEIEKNINAEVNLKDFGLNLFSDFPNLRFSLNELTVIPKNDLRKDTLAYIERFSLELDLFSVIKGDKIEILAFEIDKPSIKAHIGNDGKANWNISIAKEEKVEEKKDTSKSNFNISLRRYEINNANIFFSNDSTDMSAEITNLSHKGKGNFSQDLFLLSTKTDADGITVSDKGVKYLNKTKVDIKIDLEMDSKNNQFTFKENYIRLNEFQFSFDGYVKTVDSNNIDLNVNYKSNKTDFKSLLSLVPALYKKSFDKISTSGNLSFNGFVKGRYSKEHYPAFLLNLSAENGMFKYPELPQSAENIYISLTIDKNEGPLDLTVIDLKKLHVEFAKNPFDMSLTVRTPISDPSINLAAQGKIDFSIIPKIVPMEDISALSGNAIINIKVGGNLSDFKTQNLEKINADGSLDIDALEYADKENKKTSINKLSLALNPKNIELKTFESKLGNSDIHAWGYLNNLLAFVFGKGEILQGNLNLESKKIDLDELMSGNDAKTANKEETKPGELKVFEVPGNIDFSINTNINQLKFDNLEYQSINGSLSIKDKTVSLSGVLSNKYFILSALDGIIGLNGSYSTKNISKPEINFGLDVKDIDIKKSAEHFITIQKFAPVAKESEGKFSALFKTNSNLNQKMMPDYESINAIGHLSLKNFVVKKLAILTKIADKLKIDKYKQISINNAEIDFEIIKGRIYIKPFTINPFESKMTVSGSNGLDQTIDYLIKFEIPASQFGQNAENVMTDLTSKINKTGIKIKPQDKISIVFSVTGTFDNPEVKPIVDTKEALNDIKDQLKDKVDQELEKKKQELEVKKQELEKQAKDEIDKKKKELEDKQKEFEKKAKEEADKKKKEAEEKLKKEAEKKLLDKIKKPF